MLEIQMITDLRVRLLLIMASICIHLTLICDYWLGGLWRFFPDTWAQQYTVTIIIELLFSLLLPFIKSNGFKWLIFMLRVLGIFVITVPFANSPGKFSLIYSFLIFEGFFYFNSYFAVILNVVSIIFFCWLNYLRLPLWTLAPKTVDISALFFLWTQCFFMSGISYCLVRELKYHYQERKVLADLKDSNQYLAETNIKLQDLAIQAELITASKERSRIAREIHDALAYTLTNLIALLNALREKIKVKGEEVPLELEQARVLARDGLGDVRQVLRTLRAGDSEGYIGLGHIQRLARIFGQATGIEVTLNYADVPQFLGESLENVIYRIVQEGLTNAFRHGQATQVLISFCYYKANIEVLVWDNGVGTNEPTGGFGLIGIQERVEELGGSVIISSKQGHGFKLLVKLPLQKGMVR
jgi:signal transduction histidine kinase